MQINSTQLATVSRSTSLVVRRQAAAPAIIEPTTTNKAITRAAANVETDQQPISNTQYAHLVRLAASASQSATNQQTQTMSNGIPKGLQQYLQITDLKPQADQQLFDEIA